MKISFTMTEPVGHRTPVAIHLQRHVEAFGTATVIPTEKEKSWALFCISMAANQSKNLHLAISTARIIPINLDRDQVFLHIFHSLIDLERFILATAIAQKIQHVWQREQLFLILCWNLGKLERFTQAHRVANKIADLNVREDTHRRIEEYRKLVAHQEFANLALLS